jgi:hypothetical protein
LRQAQRLFADFFSYNVTWLSCCFVVIGGLNTLVGEWAINELMLTGNFFARLLVLNSAPARENWFLDSPGMTR